MVAVTTLLLTAVVSTRRKTSVALSADHLITVVLLSEDSEGRLNDTTTKSEDQVKSGLLLDVVVTEGSVVF